ncbi:MAG TPA: universal stress protein [Burkholderiales bacterium]|nr:universal stress protein [Burkholderiales bacterium]
MYKRILVAIDGSDTSKRALREALQLAKDGKSALRVLHVLDLVTFSTDTPSGFAAYEEALRVGGEQMLSDASEMAEKAGVACATKLLEMEERGRRVAEEIARDAEEWRAELIVIGTHGRRGMSRVLLGSVAESLVRIAPAPVLLIRGD